MKFKNLHEVNVYGCAFVPIYCLPIGLGMALLATGRSRRSHSGYRYFFTLF
jgi:hypothetical protein